MHGTKNAEKTGQNIGFLKSVIFRVLCVSAAEVHIYKPGKSSQPQINADIHCAACIRQSAKRVNGLGASTA